MGLGIGRAALFGLKAWAGVQAQTQADDAPTPTLDALGGRGSLTIINRGVRRP